MSRQTIYNRLRAGGLSETGALALLGNWECESNNEPCRVQGDFSADRHISREYASRIDNAAVSDDAWCRDALGWGLAQFTYWSRKQGLLRFCRERAISVADEEAQVDFALKELREEYGSLLDLLKNSGDLYQCTSAVCRQYERPAVNNIQQRYEAALRVKGQINTAGAEPEADSSAEEEFGICWPPRMLCVGMSGADVAALQALLLAHGYNTGGIDGNLGNRTRAMLMAFQAENDLDPDGVAGPKTWRKLLEV